MQSAQRFGSFLFVSFFAGTLVVACSTHPSGQEVVDRATTPFCNKAKECGPAAFSVTYPGGVDECVSKTKAAAAASKSAAELATDSVCTDAELDKCVSDLKAAACPATGGLPTVPCKC